MFYFSWREDGNTVFDETCHVEDEQVFSFSLQQQEGDFASLTVEIVNPRSGLLNTDREQWVWFSKRKPDGTVVPLFHGRLIGVPADLDKGVASLEFSARPADFDAQKAALAETLKVAPYYDPIWIDPSRIDDPDTVLEARPQLWHIGRTDKLVTVSHVLTGEDGTIALGAADVMRDSLSITYGQPPISKIHVDATVQWDQIGKGQVDLTGSIIEKFNHGLNIASFTGQGLEASWPAFGVGIGGGWSVYSSDVVLLSGGAAATSFHRTPIDPRKATPNFPIEPWWETSPEGYDYWYNQAYEKWLADQILDPVREARFYLWVFRPTFIVQYLADRSRSEVLSFDVSADVQQLLDEDPVTTTISISSSAVSSPLDANGAMPIGDVRNSTYFGLDRAKRSIDYLLALVQSRMLSSARAAEVQFEVDFYTGINFSCRKDILLTLDDLPGGSCRGKIIGYTLALDGNDGVLQAQVKIGCSIGKGNVLDPPDDGTPTYVETSFVEDYQFYVGSELDPFSGIITYKDFVVPSVDDGVDFYDMTPARVVGDIAATALLTLPGIGSADQTVTVGVRVYTLKVALTGANQVKIGIDRDETARNIADAINAEEDQAGISYGTGTVAHADVSATAADGIVRVTARIAGTAGNSITVSSTAGTWDQAALYGGSHGINVFYPASEQLATLNVTYGSVQEAIDALNAHFTEIEVTLKPVEGGPFDAAITLVTSGLMIPKTIDLEAA